MATNRALTWANKTNAVTSVYGDNEKLTGPEINQLRDKHNDIDNDLETVENQITGINQNISNAQQQADNNALDIETNVDSIQDLQSQLGNHTVHKNVPANAVFTDTLPHAQATNQGNVFNQANKLLQLDSNSKVPHNLLQQRISYYKNASGNTINGQTIIDHFAALFETVFVSLNGSTSFSFLKGEYFMEFEFDYEYQETFTVKLLKNGATVESNKCLHTTSFAFKAAGPTDEYTIAVNSPVQVNISNIKVVIIRG